MPTAPTRVAASKKAAKQPPRQPVAAILRPIQTITFADDYYGTVAWTRPDKAAWLIDRLRGTRLTAARNIVGSHVKYFGQMYLQNHNITKVAAPHSDTPYPPITVVDVVSGITIWTPPQWLAATLAAMSESQIDEISDTIRRHARHVYRAHAVRAEGKIAA